MEKTVWAAEVGAFGNMLEDLSSDLQQFPQKPGMVQTCNHRARQRERGRAG